MKKGTWRKQHKWLGIGLSFFMLMFCVSGILLNHRSLIKEVNVSRKYMPSRYEFRNWNGGLLRGTLDIGKDFMVDSMRNVDSCRQLLLYGNGGIWLTNSKASYFKDFNEGLPEGADYRQIKKAVAGMSQDFSTPVVAEYYEGTNFAPQPSSMNQLPMSLWNVALELAFWCLWSGYKIRLKKK